MNSNQLEHLAWDSAFLGFAVAQIAAQGLTPPLLHRLLAQARADDVRLVYLMADQADAVTADTARAAGLPLISEKVTFHTLLTPRDAENSSPEGVRRATATTPDLVNLVLQSGLHSRFRLDPRFAPHVYEHLYTQWLTNSFAPPPAEVLAYLPPQSDIPVGLLTLGQKSARADIGLLAVDSAWRGQGIGKDLVAVARKHSYLWGAAELQVVTQMANQGACRFYIRCGFRLEAVECVYHVWL